MMAAAHTARWPSARGGRSCAPSWPRLAEDGSCATTNCPCWLAAAGRLVFATAAGRANHCWTCFAPGTAGECLAQAGLLLWAECLRSCLRLAVRSGLALAASAATSSAETGSLVFAAVCSVAAAFSRWCCCFIAQLLSSSQCLVRSYFGNLRFTMQSSVS